MNMELLLVAIFLPLFPLSVVFNAVFERLPNTIVRVVLLLCWPMIGIYLLQGNEQTLPEWVLIWALGTAILYGFRLLAVRDMGIWIGFLATSVWALLWVAVSENISSDILYHAALGFSLPLAVMAILMRHIETRFGAAYTDLFGGLGVTTPRLSGLLVVAVLAATATPVFPAFFIMLHIIVNSTPGIVIAMLGAWLLWSWASARLLQGLIVGPSVGEKIQDLGAGVTWMYGLLLTAFAVAGVYVTGGLL